MNIDKIKAGDIVVFEREEQTLHGRVTSIGYSYVTSPFMSTNEPILFIRVIERPEWREMVLTSKEVKDVIITKERVQFS
jgi:hypothetical protein